MSAVMQSAPATRWTRICRLEDIPPLGARVVKSAHPKVICGNKDGEDAVRVDHG